MKFTRILTATLVGLIWATSIVAQETPRELRDLVGERASSGESELQKRGYRFVKGSEGGDRKYTNWWNNSRNLCITVATYNGRYDSIVTSPAFDCNRNNNNNSGGGQVSPPSWGRGTFYGRGPNGERIMLTINNNGAVTADVNGGLSYGSWGRGNILTINGVSSSVVRTGNGIATTRFDNRERIEYSKKSWNNDDNDFSDVQITPPSWARGTFYGTGPNDERITLTIGNDGRVTADVNGGMSYGTFSRGNFINLNGARASVTRNGSGVTTTRSDNGERIEYSRNRWNNGNNNNNWNKVDISDLVGIRASSGESEMRSRGFRNVDTFKTNNASYMIWWRSQSRQCIQVLVADGRYDSLNDIGSHPKCR